MEELKDEVEDLLEDSCSQHNDSLLPDLDSILAPLSNSQQAREADLDLKDLKLKEGHEVTTLEEEEENCLLEAPTRLRSKPRHIRRSPPGVFVLEPPRLVYNRLCLHLDIGWRPGTSSPTYLEELPSDLLEMVLQLHLETGQNRMVVGRKEFVQMADWIFYSMCACEDRITRTVLKQKLMDLVQNWGFEWKLTVTHIVTALLNLGFRHQLVRQHSELYTTSNLPPLPTFYIKYETLNQTKSLSSTNRRRMLADLLDLVSKIFTFDSLHNMKELVNHRLELIRILSLLGLDHTVIDDHIITRQITTLLYSLLDFTPFEDLDNTMMDVAELLMVEAPYQLDLISFHPHDMVALCKLMPNSIIGYRLKRLLAYLGIQLVLGVQQPDLPCEAGLPDLLAILKLHKDAWKSISRDQHYHTRCILDMMDLMYSGHWIERKLQSEHWTALRGLLDVIEEYKGRLGRQDTLDLDPVIVLESTAELINRWKMALNTAENIHTLKLTTGGS